MYLFFVYSFSDLTKHSLTSCICLIFDANGLEGFKGPEYRLPGSPAPTLIGLNSYPIMMSMPQVIKMQLDVITRLM